MAKAKDLEEALTNIETKLGGSEKPHMDLGEHLEYIESLIGGGGPGSGNVDDVKVNGASVVEDKTADIKLKTINNEDITGEGNIDIEGGVDAETGVGLTYGVSDVFDVITQEELTSAADYAEFFNGFLNKQILVSIADSAEEKHSTTTAIVGNVNYIESEGRTSLTLFTPFGEIPSEIQNGDKGEPISFSVDWSQAGNWAGGSSGINAGNFIGLTYNDSSEVYIEAADGRSFETVEDYANFLDPFNEKQFLVRIRPGASDIDTYSTDAAIILTDWNRDVYHISLETTHGIIDITITQEDVEVSDDYPTGIKLTYEVDWSKAVDWSSTGGGSGGDSDGKIGYVATFGFPFMEDPAPKVSFWFTNAQIDELEELSGGTIQDIIDHWGQLDKSTVIPELFNHSLQAKVWPDGADDESYPCTTTYAFYGEQETELYFVYLDRNSQHQRINISGDDVSNITLNADEWTGGGSGGTVDTEKIISINMTNMDCTGVDNNGDENRIIRDLQLYCTKEHWDNFVSLASSMMGVDVTYANFDSVFKTLSVSYQATAIGYFLMDYYSGKILPEAYLQQNLSTQGPSGKNKYGIVALTTLTDPQSGVEFVWDCRFRGLVTGGDQSEVGNIPAPDMVETNYYTNDTVITVQEVEGVAIASSGGGGSEGSEVSQDYLLSLCDKLGYSIYPIKKIIENSNGTTKEYDPQELQELNFDSSLYLRGDKFMPVIIPNSSHWSNTSVKIQSTSGEKLCELRSLTQYISQSGKDSSGDNCLILYLSIDQEHNDIDPQEIIIYASHSEE